MIFRGGCIIRARFLDRIMEEYEKNADLPNLLLDEYFKDKVESYQHAWRKVVSTAALFGVSIPAFTSALTYFDGYRSESLPANLLQAQRDYFGAHTFARVDKPGIFHYQWKSKE